MHYSIYFRAHQEILSSFTAKQWAELKAKLGRDNENL